MSKTFRKDLTGQRFGKLEVIKFVPDETKISKWLCKCDCENEKIIGINQIKFGTTKSCGCLKKEQHNLQKNRKTFLIGNTYNRGIKNESCFNILFNNYKYNAKKRNYEFLLSKEEFRILTSQNCIYCGIKPLNIIKSKTCYGEYIYNGIDRIDNNIGYTTDNVVPCCEICNIMKMALSQEEFLNHIKRIYEHQNLKGE